MHTCSGKIASRNSLITSYCLRAILSEIGKPLITVINKTHFTSETKEYKMTKEKPAFLNWKTFEKGLNQSETVTTSILFTE